MEEDGPQIAGLLARARACVAAGVAIPRLSRIVLSGAAFFLTGYLIALVHHQRQIPQLSNDAITYHMPAAVQWLQTGKLGLYETWFYNPANSYSPLAGSTFIAWLIAPLGNYVIARFVQVGPALLLFAAVLLFAPAFIVTSIAVPLGWPRLAYWTARSCWTMEVIQEYGAGAALYGVMTQLHAVLIGVPILQACITLSGGRYRGLLIRKEAKPHGSMRIIEGEIDPDEPVIIIDDSIVSGRTFWEAHRRLHGIA